MTRFPRPHGWLQWVAVAAAVVCLAVGIAAVVILTGGPGDVSHPDVEFTAPPATTQAQQTAAADEAQRPWLPVAVLRLRQGAHALSAAQRPIHPPYTGRGTTRPARCSSSRRCSTRGRCSCSRTTACWWRSARTSAHVRWGRKLGHLAASSPAVAGSSVYCVILERGRGIRAGRVVAVNVGSGRTRWSHKLPSRAESSPLVVGEHALLRHRERHGLRAAHAATAP